MTIHKKGPPHHRRNLQQTDLTKRTISWAGLPGDGDPFEGLVAALFEQIGDRDRVVLGADLAVAVVVDEKLIAADAVAAGALAGMDEGRRADEGPVQVLDPAVDSRGPRYWAICLRLSTPPGKSGVSK